MRVAAAIALPRVPFTYLQSKPVRCSVSVRWPSCCSCDRLQAALCVSDQPLTCMLSMLFACYCPVTVRESSAKEGRYEQPCAGHSYSCTQWYVGGRKEATPLGVQPLGAERCPPAKRVSSSCIIYTLGKGCERTVQLIKNENINLQTLRGSMQGTMRLAPGTNWGYSASFGVGALWVAYDTLTHTLPNWVPAGNHVLVTVLALRYGCHNGRARKRSRRSY